MVFASIVSIPDNVDMLKPHMRPIINNALTYGSYNKDSINYYTTIRHLFLSIATGKFEILCKEFIPILPLIIDKLTGLLRSSFVQESQPTLRDLFIELCLTVPAKLHVLCPYLSKLIRPSIIFFK
jgi:transformation/transcription domain-associated protein